MTVRAPRAKLARAEEHNIGSTYFVSWFSEGGGEPCGEKKPNPGRKHVGSVLREDQSRQVSEGPDGGALLMRWSLSGMSLPLAPL